MGDREVQIVVAIGVAPGDRAGAVSRTRARHVEVPAQASVPAVGEYDGGPRVLGDGHVRVGVAVAEDPPGDVAHLIELVGLPGEDQGSTQVLVDREPVGAADEQVEVAIAVPVGGGHRSVG